MENPRPNYCLGYERLQLKIRFVVTGAGAHMASYWCLPGQTPSRLAHAPILRAAVEFWQTTLANSPVDMQVLLKQAQEKGISESLLYHARPLAGVKTSYTQVCTF